MVRSGSRPGQVLSAGKHTGPAKLTNGRKWTHLRTIPRFNADSGYPTHSDSGSQTEAARGLDGCASLLQNILRNEDSGSEIACSENRCNPRRFEGKRHRSKRKGNEKRTVPSLVRKSILPSDYKKQIPNGTPVGRERDVPDIPQNWSFQDHYRMYSPIIYQALCEHVQTQMSLMNDSASKNKPNGIPVVPCHTVSGSGSESQATPRSSFGGCASSPVQSPQPPACPPVVHSEVQTDGDNQFVSQRKTVSANCADRLRNSFRAGLGVQCSPPPTDKAPCPAFQQLGLAKGILPQEVPKEPDLLKCFQTYMTLLCSHSDSQIHRSPTLLQPAFLATNEDSCAREPVGEVTSEEKDLNICVRDPRIKGVQKADSGNQSAEKVRTIRYLLGELKALVAGQEDSEVQRLITELEACVSLLPAASGNRNTQVEVALALQPLRGENAQLRRQLRILNQQLREQGKTKKASGSQECDLELFSLQSLNKSLQNQLQESLKSQESLQSKNEELLKVIENQNDENKKFAGIFKEKDQTILENKQQFDLETTRIKIELEEAVVNLKSCQFKLEAAEKENQILGITLRQRDAEVTRLRDLTRTLQGSMAKLLSDLSVDAARRRPGSGLTTSLLSAHEKQPQHERVPARASILSYLRRVEPGPAGTAALWERDSEEDGGHAAPVEGGCDPGSAVGAPCARSPSRRKSPPSKGLSPRPAPLLGSDGGSQARAPRARPSGKEAGDAPEAPSRADTEHGQLLRQVKDAVRRSPAVAEGRSLRCQVGSSVSDGSFLRSDWTSDWSASSFSTFTSRDEQDFRSGLAALDANIARLQESLRSGPPGK